MIPYITSSVVERYQDTVCLVRIDLNTEPYDASFRVRQIVPTVQLLRRHGVRVILLAHKGRYADHAPSLRPFVPVLSRLLKEPVGFVLHDDALSTIARAREQILLMENLRMMPEEEQNDTHFATSLAQLGEWYIEDAFSVTHRLHASVASLPRFLPSYGGLRLQEELVHLDAVLKEPAAPVTLILGGAKIQDKLAVIHHLWDQMDYILLGGGPANTALAAEGVSVGSSLVDSDAYEALRSLPDVSKLILPSDFVSQDGRYVDIGTETMRTYQRIIRESRTIIWNGPMGIFEQDVSAAGTQAIWQVLYEHEDARVVVGGGDTLASLQLIDSEGDPPEHIFLSTGGGAMLSYLSGVSLPGITVLNTP